MTTTDFNYNEPLPDLHIQQQRSWEPAARHYQDLTDAEKAENLRDRLTADQSGAVTCAQGVADA